IIFYSNVGARVEQYYYDRIAALQKTDDPNKEILIQRYKNILANHWEKSDSAATTLRRQSTELLARTNAIPLYNVWAFWGCVCRLPDVLAASSELIGMANSAHSENNIDMRIKEIIKWLNLKALAKHRGL